MPSSSSAGRNCGSNASVPYNPTASTSKKAITNLYFLFPSVLFADNPFWGPPLLFLCMFPFIFTYPHPFVPLHNHSTMFLLFPTSPLNHKPSPPFPFVHLHSPPCQPEPFRVTSTWVPPKNREPALETYVAVVNSQVNNPDNFHTNLMIISPGRNGQPSSP